VAWVGTAQCCPAAKFAPDWGIGVALGFGGLIGGYGGARIQPRLPEEAIRRLLGGIVAAIGVRYAYLAEQG
jgi:hypothetical protein